jgi:hypothetical protein
VLDFNQTIPATAVRLSATVEDLPSGALLDVQSTVVKAEGFLYTQGDPGTGFALYPSDGLLDEFTEAVHYDIPVAHFATLDSGTYDVLVVGKDKAGNWGLAGSASITVIAQGQDLAGPTVYGLAADPNPSGGSRTVTLTALAQDSLSNVSGAAWFVGTDPAGAKTYKMSAADGSFDSLSETITADIRVQKWQAGDYQISAFAIDAVGNWGPITTIILTVQ